MPHSIKIMTPISMHRSFVWCEKLAATTLLIRNAKNCFHVCCLNDAYWHIVCIIKRLSNFTPSIFEREYNILLKMLASLLEFPYGDNIIVNVVDGVEFNQNTKYASFAKSEYALCCVLIWKNVHKKENIYQMTVLQRSQM